MKKRIAKCFTVLVICLLIFVVYYFLNKNYGFSIPCMFQKITGYYCPGCGITRCLFAILRFKFYDAFMYNQLAFILLPFLGIWIMYKIYIYIVDKEDNFTNKIPYGVWIVLLIIVIAFGIVRNLNGFEFLLP